MNRNLIDMELIGRWKQFAVSQFRVPVPSETFAGRQLHGNGPSGRLLWRSRSSVGPLRGSIRQAARYHHKVSISVLLFLCVLLGIHRAFFDGDIQILWNTLAGFFFRYCRFFVCPQRPSPFGQNTFAGFLTHTYAEDPFHIPSVWLTCFWHSIRTNSSRLPTVTAMKPLYCQSVLMVATAEGTLRMLDTRSPINYQHELKASVHFDFKQRRIFKLTGDIWSVLDIAFRGRTGSMFSRRVSGKLGGGWPLLRNPLVGWHPHRNAPVQLERSWRGSPSGKPLSIVPN